MDLRQLKLFVAVAGYGSIAEAARQIHIAQPALSRQISALESAMGAQLFHRKARGVVLTAAGEELRHRANEILGKASALKGHVVNAMEGKSGTLRIGVLPGYSWIPPLAESLSTLLDDMPAVSAVLTPALSKQQMDAIKREELDVGLAAWRSPWDAELTGLHVFTDKLGIAVPASMGLSEDASLHLSDFTNQPFLLGPREHGPAFHDALMRAFSRAGFSPATKKVVAMDMPTLLGLVSAGVGCAVVPEAQARRTRSDIRFFLVGGLDITLTLDLVWRTENQSRLLELFVKTVSSHRND